MGKVAVDFGTSNTVLARLSESTQRVETIPIPGITSQWRYRLRADGPVDVINVAPSMIYYGEDQTLIGDQVVSAGLTDHRNTFRWMKQAISLRHKQSKVTPQGRRTYAEAGEEFLRTVLQYAGNIISIEDDEFTFTAPVEAFEDFQDWIWRVAESAGIRRIRLLDEPTACIFGYEGALSSESRYTVFDFGAGTLDVSCIRLDMQEQSGRKAVQLGKAGENLGGMNIDQWIAQDFCERHGISQTKRRELEGLLFRSSEQTKIALSRPGNRDEDMILTDATSDVPRSYTTTYYRSCPSCKTGSPRNYDEPGECCLGCLLAQRDFLAQVKGTVERALENAAVNAGMRRSEISHVLVTGGTSLIPSVHKFLRETFGDRIHYERPFDCVARGACGGTVVPVLQHDYALESFDPETGNYGFKPLFESGTEYPTRNGQAKRRGVGGAFDGQTEIELLVFEVSSLVRRDLGVAIVDDAGRLQDRTRVTTHSEYICLNRNTPTCIPADPPVNIAREGELKRDGRPVKRFGCHFAIDDSGRLVVDVVDRLTGREIYKQHPVVRL